MTPHARVWLAGLQECAAAFRRGRPLADPSAASAEQAAQRAMLAADLTTWIDGEVSGYPASYAIVLTTSELGIAVMAEMLARGEPVAASLRDRLVAVRENEYRLWTKDHPDPDHRLHINHWSWIKAPVPKQRWHEFRAFPLREGEDYWLHRTGTSGPGPENTRHAHLWRWTGSQAVLLKPFIQERVEAL